MGSSCFFGVASSSVSVGMLWIQSAVVSKCRTCRILAWSLLQVFVILRVFVEPLRRLYPFRSWNRRICLRVSSTSIRFILCVRVGESEK